MPDYRAPLRDMQFLLHEVFKASELWASMPKTSEVNRELADAVLEESARINSTLIAPLNRSSDEEGVHWSPEGVKTPEGFIEAFKELAAGGWLGLTGASEYGGQEMPKMLSVLFEEMLSSASMAFFLYPNLTMGAALALEAHGSDELKSTYLPKMYSGEWTGAMCLTEAHAGTDLGMIRTKAIPEADGSYRVTGTKIFITAGEHDLTDNIVHLVLAKLPDAPAGSKGISLFLVPKVNVNEDGSLGERNGVHCASVEHKMGIHASATCVMNFDDAKGYLVGEVNKGLAAMFTMMNYERLGVGIQGLGCGQAAYQWSAEYARDRLQSRSPDGPKNPDGPADPIVVHPDVRRMLLTQKALTEGGRALGLYVGQQLDVAKSGEAEAQQAADALVALLTPVAKAFLTDMALDSCVMGQQVFGGHGYIREWGMEQLVRDVRIAQIYEGTNGIQAQDLIGRKVIANGGKAMAHLVAEMRQTLSDEAGNEAVADLIDPTKRAIDQLESVTGWLLEQSKQDPFAGGAASVEYLHLTGYTMYAWFWLRMAAVAAQSDNDATFLEGKQQTARFYMQRVLPRIYALGESIKAGSDTMMAPAEAMFSVD